MVFFEECLCCVKSKSIAMSLRLFVYGMALQRVMYSLEGGGDLDLGEILKIGLLVIIAGGHNDQQTDISIVIQKSNN